MRTARIGVLSAVVATLLGCGSLFGPSGSNPSSDGGSLNLGDLDAGCQKPCGATCCQGDLVCNPVTRNCDRPCQPQCGGRQCGSNGCGGSCGSCGAGTRCSESTGTCQACKADCTSRQCGDDGCSGNCGSCPVGRECTLAGACESCVPKCSGKACGPDSCGGSCGSCAAGASCDTFSGKCLGCRIDADCAGSKQGTRCEASSGRCVPCLADADCKPDGTVRCDGATKTCDVTCSSDADCAAAPGARRCDGATKKCVACLSSVDCAAPLPACDPITKACALCATDQDCTGNPSGPRCKDRAACVACLGDAECFGKKCDPQTNTCGQCSREADCAQDPVRTHCNTSTRQCVQCRSAGDCVNVRPVCSALGLCIECQGDSDCSRAAGRPRCHQERCVQCARGADCPSGVCTSTNTCSTGGPLPDRCGVVQGLTFVNDVATISGDTSLAADDGNGTCFQAPGNDLVYSFFISSAKNVDVSLAALGSHRPAVYLRRVCTSTSTSDEVGCDAPIVPGGTATLSLKNVASGPYFVWVDGVGQGKFSLRVSLSNPGTGLNDDCATAESITLGPAGTASVQGSTLLANRTTTGSCGGSGPDVVYKYSVPMTLPNVRVVAKVTPSAGSSSFQPLVYARLRCSSTSQIDEAGCAVASVPGQVAVFNRVFASLPAGTYYLWVDGANDTSGDFTLDVSLTSSVGPTEICGDGIDNDSDGFTDCLDTDCAADPACGASGGNDNCTPPNAPAALLFSARTAFAAGTTAAARNDTSSPACGGTGPDVVYAFTNPSAQSFSASVTGSLAGFTPVLYLRSGSCSGTEVACGYAPSSGGRASLAVTSLSAGDYYLWVDGSSSTKGTFTLSATLGGGTSANGQGSDRCSAPPPTLTFTADRATASGTTAGYSNDGVGTCAGSGPDVMYAMSLPLNFTSITAKVTPGSTAYRPVVHIRGSCDVQSTEVRCSAASAPGASASVTATGLSSGTYYIWVDSWSGTSGRYTLDVTRM